MLLRRYATIATSDDKRNTYLVIHPFSPSRPLALIQRFSNSQKVKLTTSLVKTPCRVCLVPPCSHPNLPDGVLVPYVVGTNPNSPLNPHSAMASGGDDISNINTSPPAEAYTLYGAVIGGPDKRDRYWDLRDDWPQTEVRLTPVLSSLAIDQDRSVGRHRLQRTSPHSRRHACFERHRRPTIYLAASWCICIKQTEWPSMRPRLQLLTIA